MNLDSNSVCSKCGSQLASANTAAPAVATAAPAKKRTLSIVIGGLAVLLVLVAFLTAIGGQLRKTEQTTQDVANAQLVASDKMINDAFAKVEKTVRGRPALEKRLKELRAEYREARGDRQKLTLFLKKADRLMEDIQKDKK
jgi:cell shape-determining protein MreC